MPFSRWKLMAGVLGVSLGGLAAVAGQCPKGEKVARQAPDLPSKVEAPMIPAVPPAGSGPATPMPPAPSVPAPPAPSVPPPPAEIPALPPLPSKAPESPPLLPAPVDTAKKPDMPVSSPPMPPSLPVIPAGGTTTPQAPPSPDVPKPTTPPAIDLKPSAPATPPTPPVDTTPPLTFETPRTPGADTPGSPKAVVANKYRILLRVGEGEPTFEVRSGDDLLLKVVCEKVDIKSPDKGNGPSAVTARGKVRFAGFGAEGTCQELSFLAGTGEVSMAGEVKIQVKDKLGRVESELSTASMKYKIDPSTIGGSLKP